MSSPFEVINLNVLTLIFSEELDYIRRNRYKFLEHKPAFLEALSQNIFSTHHLAQIKSMMDNEAAEQAKVEADKQRIAQKASLPDSRSLTGSHRYV